MPASPKGDPCPFATKGSSAVALDGARTVGGARSGRQAAPRPHACAPRSPASALANASPTGKPGDGRSQLKTRQQRMVSREGRRLRARRALWQRAPNTAAERAAAGGRVFLSSRRLVDTESRAGGDGPERRRPAQAEPGPALDPTARHDTSVKMRFFCPPVNAPRGARCACGAAPA